MLGTCKILVSLVVTDMYVVESGFKWLAIGSRRVSNEGDGVPRTLDLNFLFLTYTMVKVGFRAGIL